MSLKSRIVMNRAIKIVDDLVINCSGIKFDQKHITRN
jgi:hypothetical protein